MIFIVIMKADDKYYILSNENGVISSSKTAEEWVANFEDMYNRNHDRSYEGSMSACINYILYQPSIVGVEGPEDIKERLLNMPFTVANCWSVAGGFTGCTSDKDMSEEWDKGIKPRLIVHNGEEGYKTKEQLRAEV